MSSKPKIPDPLPPPAKRPERAEAVTAEDIQLGAPEEEAGGRRGKRALARPAPVAGVGLSL